MIYKRCSFWNHLVTYSRLSLGYSGLSDHDPALGVLRLYYRVAISHDLKLGLHRMS